MVLFRKIWAVYGVLVFSLLVIISFPYFLITFLLFPNRGINALIWYNHQIFTRLFFALMLIRVQVEGKELLEQGEAYIIISNHRTSIDFIANALAFPGIYRYLAKKELVRIPLFGEVIKRVCVLVDRSSMRSRAKSIAYLRQVLRTGVSVCIYPEGTRNRSKKPLEKFHAGAFRLAIATGAPIAVQTIVNARQISSSAHSLDLTPGTLHIVWSPPIETASLTQSDLPYLMELVRSYMLENMECEPVFEAAL